jgi:hypothetical protein
MNLEDFEKRYVQAREQSDDLTQGSASVEFCKYPSEIVRQYAVRTTDADFLQNVGLPRRAAPYLRFENLYETYPELNDYFYATICLGTASRDRFVAIDGYSDKIYCIEFGDDGFEKLLVNSSLEAFAECLCLFEECIDKTQLHTVYEAMRRADEALKEEDNFWRQETEGFIDNVLNAINEAANRRNNEGFQS